MNLDSRKGDVENRREIENRTEEERNVNLHKKTYFYSCFHYKFVHFFNVFFLIRFPCVHFSYSHFVFNVGQQAAERLRGEAEKMWSMVENIINVKYEEFVPFLVNVEKEICFLPL